MKALKVRRFLPANDRPKLHVNRTETNANGRAGKTLNNQGKAIRAPRSGRGGRRFKSCHSDQNLAQSTEHSGTDIGTETSRAGTARWNHAPPLTHSSHCDGGIKDVALADVVIATGLRPTRKRRSHEPTCAADPLTLNQRVQGSSPCAPTIKIKHLVPRMAS
jgi:hypothetical protein